MRERAARASTDAPSEEEDTSYLEYLNPGGPMDARYIEEDEESDEEDESDEDDE